MTIDRRDFLKVIGTAIAAATIGPAPAPGLLENDTRAFAFLFTATHPELRDPVRFCGIEGCETVTSRGHRYLPVPMSVDVESDAPPTIRLDQWSELASPYYDDARVSVAIVDLLNPDVELMRYDGLRLFNARIYKPVKLKQIWHRPA